MSGALSSVRRPGLRGKAATSGEQAQANAVFNRLCKTRAARVALAGLIGRQPDTVIKWYHVPSVHVRPFLNAYESGRLERAIRAISPVVTPAECRQARDIVRKIRARRGGKKILGEVLKVAPDSVKTWDEIPLRHVRPVLVRFGADRSLAGSDVPPVKTSASTAQVSGVWHRKCLYCGEAFTVKSPFIRRCETHRGQG